MSVRKIGARQDDEQYSIVLGPYIPGDEEELWCAVESARLDPADGWELLLAFGPDGPAVLAARPRPGEEAFPIANPRLPWPKPPEEV